MEVKNIFTRIKHKEEGQVDHLKERLMTKYLIDENTADLWIYEYYKYLVIKIKLKNEAYPSAIVQGVLHTHMEFTKDYR